MPRRYSFESELQPYQPPTAPSASPPQPPSYHSPPHSPLHHAAYSDVQRPEYEHLNTTASPPPPPPHRNLSSRPRHSRDSKSMSTDRYSDRVKAAGMSGPAMGPADSLAREGGPEGSMSTTPPQQHDPRTDYSSYDESPYARPTYRQDYSQSSLTPLGAAALPPGQATPSLNSSVSRSNTSLQDSYPDGHVYYNRHSRAMTPNMEFDPNSIEDDGDDGLEYNQQKNQRLSMLNLNSGSGAAAGGAAAGGIMGTLGGLVGRNASGGNVPQYDPVGPSATAYTGANDYDVVRREKNQWLKEERTAHKKKGVIVGVVALVVILIAIVGGLAGGLLSRNSGSGGSKSGGQSASTDSTTNGDLSKDSAEIQKLLGNTNLHKVFPGIDYTPMNTQYPDCLTNPPSQNNVTRDLAVLSQLTNTIRLYGTDCNQTEMLLHSIDRLGLNGTVKVWLGVWQDSNATTNARQLKQMYSILDTYGAASFLGVIVGNEVLYREDMTAAELGTVITNVRSNLTSRGLSNLAIASSDLGDNWSTATSLVTLVDYVMANIHPFFAGVNASAASAWTVNFFDTHDVNLKSDKSKAIISETGWPSAGGTDCGTTTVTDCPNAAVAGISEMNTFMDTFVCDALTNGTNYFWFEAFDEPWKVMYNTAGKEWEDKWGLMDVNRNLKTGVVIPDCGGKTVGAASA
ncbi:hypothetical protein BP6252_11706 [Coleophoma cylindrospora]|uniref:glucan endo-1,3-beta-D-glucosidase n=1 Tax=Coleophoma cylindrospora TaxID=1849047 RepID=A0A3D8QKC5_9HELO|nr:hypothetical protein BP6252_11706 [Coleophoma cylindrospora]